MTGNHATLLPDEPDHIDLTDLDQVRYWTRSLGVSLESLKRITDKVGKAPAAVRDELAQASQLRARAYKP
jgi:hypothetical protein